MLHLKCPQFIIRRSAVYVHLAVEEKINESWNYIICLQLQQNLSKINERMLQVLSKCNLGPLTNIALWNRLCIVAQVVFFSFSTENTKWNAYTGNEHILSLELLNSFRSCQRYIQDNERINTPRQMFSNSFYHTKWISLSRKNHIANNWTSKLSRLW